MSIDATPERTEMEGEMNDTARVPWSRLRILSAASLVAALLSCGILRADPKPARRPADPPAEPSGFGAAFDRVRKTVAEDFLSLQGSTLNASYQLFSCRSQPAGFIKAFLSTNPHHRPDRVYLVKDEYDTLGEAVDAAAALVKNVNPKWRVSKPSSDSKSQSWRVTPTDTLPALLVTAGPAGIPGGLVKATGLRSRASYVIVQIPRPD